MRYLQEVPGPICAWAGRATASMYCVDLTKENGTSRSLEKVSARATLEA